MKHPHQSLFSSKEKLKLKELSHITPLQIALSLIWAMLEYLHPT
jgi:hypothetical protein